jgi:hypothetical protein
VYGISTWLRPTQQEAQVHSDRYELTKADFVQFHQKVSTDASLKLANCEKMVASMGCVKTLWRMISQAASQHDRVLSSLFGITKKKYMRYLHVKRIGYGVPESIDDYLDAEYTDAVKHNCEEYKSMFAPDLYTPGGEMYNQMRKMYNKLDGPEDMDADFRQAKDFFVQDMNVHVTSWCGVVKRFYASIKDQLQQAVDDDFWKCNIKCPNPARNDINKGLSTAEIQAARRRAAQLFELLESSCTPQNALLEVGQVSCAELRRGVGDTVKLPDQEALVTACQTALGRKSKFDALCKKK